MVARCSATLEVGASFWQCPCLNQQVAPSSVWCIDCWPLTLAGVGATLPISVGVIVTMCIMSHILHTALGLTASGRIWLWLQKHSIALGMVLLLMQVCHTALFLPRGAEAPHKRRLPLEATVSKASSAVARVVAALEATVSKASTAVARVVACVCSSGSGSGFGGSSSRQADKHFARSKPGRQ